MAKKQTPASILTAHDKKHLQDTEKYVNQVKILYNRAIDEITKLIAANPDLLGQDDFTFAKKPGLDKKVTEIIRGLSDSITAVIDRGDRNAWVGACVKSDQFIESILNTSKLPKAKLQKYQDRNLESLAAFQERKINGLNLSERVWNYISPLKDETELAIDTSRAINSQENIMKLEEGIGTGKSAAEMSRDVRSCLKEPNKLFRRVRDKNGNLVLSKAAKLYHPGQGVYRSSYKNAMRLTRSEINMAYRQSDHMRWSQLDFVVGQDVSLSNNHTIIGKDGKTRVPLYDICDVLVGRYPKDAKLVGWHPQCRCVITPVLKSLDELDQEIDAKGNYRDLPSASEVKEMPKAFNDYIKENEKRIAGWSSKPYYIKDNPQYVDKALHPEKYIKKSLTLTEDQQLHMSELEMYGYNHSGSKKFNAALDDAKKAILAGDQKAYDDALATMEFTKATNERIQAFNAKKKAGIVELELSEKEKQYINAYNSGGNVGKLYSEEETEKIDGAYKELASTHKYTDEQKKAIRKYASGSYDLNTAIENSDLTDKQKEMIAVLDTAFKPLKEDVIVYKGWIKGEFQETAGYQSTTTYLPTARDFATNKGGILAFRIPKGTPVIFGNELENEIVLPRGFKMLTHKIDTGSVELTREEKIKAAAEKRHAARTPEKEKKLKEFAAKHKKQTEDVYAEIKALAKDTADIAFVDTNTVEGMMSGKIGVETESGKKLPTTLEKMKKELKAAQAKKAEYDKLAQAAEPLVKELDGISDVDTQFLKTATTKEEIQEATKKLQAAKDKLAKLSTLDDPIQVAKDYSLADAVSTHNSVIKKIKEWKDKYSKDAFLKSTYTEEEYLAKKLDFEAYTYLGTNMNDVQSKFNTWQVAQNAYIKKLKEVKELIWKKDSYGVLNTLNQEIIAMNAPKSGAIIKAWKKAQNAVASGDHTAYEEAIEEYNQQKTKLLAKQAKQSGSSAKKIKLREIPDEDCMKLINAFESDTTESADDYLRPILKKAWKKLTDDQKRMLTKYTETYEYLNKPLRNLRYTGWRSEQEAKEDLVRLTEALAKQKTKKDMVVRRGTDDYPIPELGIKSLNDLKPGQEFTDGAFLSTAVKTDAGFFREYNIVIVVPKGAQGTYAEPFSYYTGYGPNGNKYEHDGEIWDGVFDANMAEGNNEREWIGQRGCRFKVIKKDGDTIYLKMIGQMYDQPKTKV